MAISTDAPAATPVSDGQLVNRVQQLRLNGAGSGASSGSRRGAWLPWVLCGVMALAWVGIGIRDYQTPKASEGDSTAKAPAKNSPSSESAAPAAPGELLLQIKGTLTPALQINLSPDDVSGVVTDIFFKEGDRVEKGTVLAKIRNDRYLNDYHAAKAAKEAAEYRLAELRPESVRTIEKEQAQAELDEAKAAWGRADLEIKRLAPQRDSGVIPSEVWEKAEADLKSAAARVIRLEKAYALLVEGPRKERLNAAQAELASATARFQEAERLLKNCEVRAPISGTILTKVADQGVLVSPMSFNVAAGICSMADLSDMEAEIDVREDQITLIRSGLECQVSAIANPNRIYRGRVDRIMPIADDTKNTVKVRVKVQLPPGETPGEFLKPKMSVVVRVYNTEIPPFTTH
jgi:HlyD family secretion protein